jgi:hypothetical protein
MKKAIVYSYSKLNNGDNFLDRDNTLPIGIIEIPDELEYKFRIMEQLSAMALEECPMLNPPIELKSTPISLWPKESLKSETYEKIDELCLKYEGEVDSEFFTIVNAKFKTSFSTKDLLIEYYLPNEEDKKENVEIVLFIIPNR